MDLSLHREIESFLMNSNGDISTTPIEDIRNTLKEYSNAYSELKRGYNSEHDELASLNECVSMIQNAIGLGMTPSDDENCDGDRDGDGDKTNNSLRKEDSLSYNHERYMMLENEIEVLQLKKMMCKLGSSSTSVVDIPSVVLEISSVNVSVGIANELKMKAYILEVVKNVKMKILNDCTANFEIHLNVHRSNDSSSSSTHGNNVKKQTSDKQWTDYLTYAPILINAYILSSLLSISLLYSQSVTKKALMYEMLYESLDEILTPLLGKLNFHLSNARETRSLDQILWTYGYATNHLSMMIDLCDTAVAFGYLDKLCNRSCGIASSSSSAGSGSISIRFKDCCRRYIMSKACKFLRAHYANVISILCTEGVGNDQLMILIEATLELDHSLEELGTAATNSDSDDSFLSNTSALTVSAITCDVSSLHYMWVDVDVGYFYGCLAKAASTDRGKPYNVSMIKQDGANTHCYNCITECFALFSTAMKRYAYMPAASQDVFSECILEPILCISLALLLVKIRSCIFLQSIANGIIPKNCDRVSKEEYRLTGDKYVVPNQLVEFAASCDFYQMSLDTLQNKLNRFTASRKRYEVLWQEVFAWLPKKYIEFEQFTGMYSPASVVEKVRGIVVNRNTYNNIASHQHARSMDDGIVEDDDGIDSIRYAVDVTRLQVISISLTLESKWKNSNSFSRY